VLDADERAELQRLRRENAELRLDREFLKNPRPSSSPSTTGRAYRVIEADKTGYTVQRMCELLEVSRSGFYKWRKSRQVGPTPVQQRRAVLDTKVAAFHLVRAAMSPAGAQRPGVVT
jgi:transposase-like protein